MQQLPSFHTGPWPEIIMRSFFIAGLSASSNSDSFNGSWNRLLFTLFPATDATFEVVPDFPPEASVVLLICLGATSPVFILWINSPEGLGLASKRQEVDEALRRRLGLEGDNLKIPVLHGVAAFGTKLAFYEYRRDTRCVEPRSINGDSADMAPREWWAFDILEDEGANKFREVIEEVKEMCGKVPIDVDLPQDCPPQNLLV